VSWAASIVILAIGVALANAFTARKVWRSSLFERPQKIAQTVLIWLVPGTFLLVRYFLRDPMQNARKGTGGDPTVNRDSGYIDENPSFLTSHGPDGGGHGL
jgi:hypothetical protein